MALSAEDKETLMQWMITANEAGISIQTETMGVTIPLDGMDALETFVADLGHELDRVRAQVTHPVLVAMAAERDTLMLVDARERWGHE